MNLYMYYTLALFEQLLILISVIAILITISEKLLKIQTTLNTIASPYNSSDVEELQASDKVAESNEEFSQRIERIKDELARESAYIMNNATVAEELHPNVHNLPHNTINAEEREQELEVSI